MSPESPYMASHTLACNIVNDANETFNQIHNSEQSLQDALANPDDEEADGPDTNASSFQIADGLSEDISDATNDLFALTTPLGGLGNKVCAAYQNMQIPRSLQVMWRLAPVPVLVWLATSAATCFISTSSCIETAKESLELLHRIFGGTVEFAMQTFVNDLDKLLVAIQIGLESWWQPSSGSTNGKIKSGLIGLIQLQRALILKVIGLVSKAPSFWYNLVGKNNMLTIVASLGRLLIRVHEFVSIRGAACLAFNSILSYYLQNPKFWVKIASGLADSVCAKSLLEGEATLLRTIGFPIVAFGLTKFLCRDEPPLDFRKWKILRQEETRTVIGKVGGSAVKALSENVQRGASKLIAEMENVVWT